MGNFLNCQAVRVSRVLRDLGAANGRSEFCHVTCGWPMGEVRCVRWPEVGCHEQRPSQLWLSVWVFRSINSEIRSSKSWNQKLKDWNSHIYVVCSYRVWNTRQGTILTILLFSYDTSNKSTKGASKQRRDSINHEINKLRDLLPIPASARWPNTQTNVESSLKCFRQRLSQLQLMALILVYVRKTNYFEKRESFYPELNGQPQQLRAQQQIGSKTSK